MLELANPPILRRLCIGFFSITSVRCWQRVIPLDPELLSSCTRMTAGFRRSAIWSQFSVLRQPRSCSGYPLCVLQICSDLLTTTSRRSPRSRSTTWWPSRRSFGGR